jgi:hypothetical protein
VPGWALAERAEPPPELYNQGPFIMKLGDAVRHYLKLAEGGPATAKPKVIYEQTLSVPGER